MRFRLRTLLIVVTAAAVIAAIAGTLLKARRPVPIVASVSGKQAIERLSNAKSARIEVYWPPSQYDVDLPPESKRQLVAWLSEGVRDDHPINYVMSGTIKLEPPTDPAWCIMELNSIELGLRVDGKSYWRGLSRRKFEGLVLRGAASTDNPRTTNP
jgi:hypothetical protein